MPNPSAPCGLACFECRYYVENQNQQRTDKTDRDLRLNNIPPEVWQCNGCRNQKGILKSHELFFNRTGPCHVYKCTSEKGIDFCYQCDEFPCQLVEHFPLPVGRRVMKRAIPLWREFVAQLGDEKGSVEWARRECERYHCPDCGEPLFRGAITCRKCKKVVADELDGYNQF